MKSISIEKLLDEKSHIVIDVVGDSITNGLNHCDLSETYVAQYADMVAKKYPNVSIFRYDGLAENALAPLKGFSEAVTVQIGNSGKRIDIIKNGIGGNTVRRAINRIGDFTGVLPGGAPSDITIFMFGINDALKSDPTKYVTPKKFYEDYCELLQKFRKTEKSEIVIMSATTNDQSIDEHVKMTKKLAEEFNLLYIDQNTVWNSHYDSQMPNFGHGDWLSGDEFDACHPTPKGARVIAETLFLGVN